MGGGECGPVTGWGNPNVILPLLHHVLALPSTVHLMWIKHSLLSPVRSILSVLITSGQRGI